MDFVKPIMKTFVYPMMRLRRGNRTLQYLKELKDSEKAPPSQLAGLQRDLLEKLLDTCVNRTSAYRLPEGTDDGSLPKRWKSIAPLSREVFRAHPEKYLARGVKREHLIPASSGGSTDAPLKFVLDKYTVEHYEAARWRGLSWWGITPTDRSVMLWSSPVELDAAAGKYHRRREKWLKNRVVIPARALNEASLPLHIKFLNRYRPVYFYGFPSALYLFATLMEAAGAQLSFQPKVVVSTAEMLFDFQRETISRVLGCPVANEYCTKEAGLLAFECPRGGLHISCENVLLEALDPLAFKPMPLGEQGVLAATDLNNLSMPRPRFLVGDIISLSSAACPCGRALPLLGSIEGRLGDMLVARDGSFVHGGEMVRLSRATPSVERFQICQHTPEKASLYIVPSGVANERELDNFTENLRSFLRGVDITPRIVADIPPMASGKHRYAVREFPLSAVRNISRPPRDDEETDGMEETDEPDKRDKTDEEDMP